MCECHDTNSFGTIKRIPNSLGFMVRSSRPLPAARSGSCCRYQPFGSPGAATCVIRGCCSGCLAGDGRLRFPRRAIVAIKSKELLKGAPMNQHVSNVGNALIFLSLYGTSLF